MNAIKKWALRRKADITALSRGYFLFQMAYTTDADPIKNEDGFLTAGYDARHVRRFCFYAPADDALEEVLQTGAYTSASLLGWNLFAWLTRDDVGAWHSFYLATKAPKIPYNASGYTASARMN